MRSKALLNVTLMLCLCVIVSVASAQQAEHSFPTMKPAGDLNILTEQEKEDGWQLLFNGKNLDGWNFDRGEWKVVDGIIVSSGGAGHLFTDRQYKNVEVQWYVCAYDIAVPKQRFGNSGVFLRGIKTGGSFPRGYELR